MAFKYRLSEPQKELLRRMFWNRNIMHLLPIDRNLLETQFQELNEFKTIDDKRFLNRMRQYYISEVVNKYGSTN